ncbi:hypothetical protein LEP1GSC173_3420 [Leptospira interrogans str. HAI1594]|nr:hypothetical protein LEP1GSC173_3420 [Leptospira interrogans str. HAI1594]
MLKDEFSIVSILWKRSIEVVLLIAVMKSFNNSNMYPFILKLRIDSSLV